MRVKFCALFFELTCFLLSCSTQQQDESGSLLGKGFGISDVTLLVQDLDSARNYYAEVLGFEMPKPEAFEKGAYEGTRSAKVLFANFATLEFLSVNDTARALTPSFITAFLEYHEGVRMYSLSTSSTAASLARLKAMQFETDSIRSPHAATELPKGWNENGFTKLVLKFNHATPPAHLPGFSEYVNFVYQEFQDNRDTYNAYVQKYYKHPNGAVGITALGIVVEDLNASRKEFKKMGFTELEATDSVARFEIVKDQELRLLNLKTSDNELSDFYKARGAGVFAIQFEVKKLQDTYAFLKKKLPAEAFNYDSLQNRLTVFRKYAHGVQLEFKEQSEEQARLAKVYSNITGVKLDSASAQYASGLYTKYCALCHGQNREGYAADNAPSLRSRSLMATTQSPRPNYNFLYYTIAYGRQGTAMAGYSKEQGGPLNFADIELLIQWLYELSGVEEPVKLSTESITGNAAHGKTLYEQKCASCHGIQGEGVSAPALGNAMLLATASDQFLRYAIAEGRDGTLMPSFKDSLNQDEINNLVAYLRSRASGWSAPEAITVTEPLPENYVLNPHSKTPKFTLREDQYVSAEQVLKALQDSLRMVILDARSKSAWHQMHIPGAVPVPYYDEPDTFIEHIPNDSTYIVVYCACPHAASGRVVNTLRRFGYKNTAILDEGILVWAQWGYPVQSGQDRKDEQDKK